MNADLEEATRRQCPHLQQLQADRVRGILQNNVGDSDACYTNIPVIGSGPATIVAWSQTPILHVVFSVHGNSRDGASSAYIVGNVVWRVLVLHILSRALRS